MSRSSYSVQKEKALTIFRLESGYSSGKGANYYSYYPALSRLKEPAYSRLSSIPPEVEKLAHRLAQFPDVDAVRAVVPRKADLHEIVFELKLQPGMGLTNELWEKVQDLVIESEWGLRDRTGESWYFDAQTVPIFSKVTDAAEVVAASHTQRPQVGRTVWQRFFATDKVKRYSSALS